MISCNLNKLVCMNAITIHQTDSDVLIQEQSLLCWFHALSSYAATFGAHNASHVMYMK